MNFKQPDSLKKVNLLVLLCLLLSCDKEPVKTASITGLVQNAGTPIGGVTVNMQTGDKKTTVNTSNDGKFEFKSLPRGDYHLSTDFDMVVRNSNDTTYKIKGKGQIDAQINRDGENLVVNIESTLEPYFTTASGGGGGSCPYIYGFNGSSYDFYGDIYAGAIYPNLERDDYTPLPGLKTINGEYRLKISNELQERHYTNLAELWLVEHPENTQAYVDKYGKVQIVQNPQSPLSALSSDGFDYTPYLQARDQQKFQFSELLPGELSFTEKLIDPILPQDGKCSLVLDFEKAPEAESCKLLVNVKNTEWSVYLWHNFITLFGEKYSERQKKQSEKPFSELMEWQLEESVPLLVYVETENGWQFVDYYHTVGSVSARELVLALDLKKVKGRRLRIKLECAYRFWEIDYAAVDYSNRAEYKLIKLNPGTNASSAQIEINKVLCSDDTYYLKHLQCGDESEIRFTAPAANSNGRTSLYLHSKGYYEQIFDNKGEMQTMKLLGFLRPGSFAQYSRKSFLQFQSRSLQLAAN